MEKVERRREIKELILIEKDEGKLRLLHNRYKEQDKVVKRSARADKRKFIENLAEEAEQANKTQDIIKLYDITRTLSGQRRKTQNNKLLNKDGKVLTGEKKKMERWVEFIKDYFQDVVPETDFEMNEGTETT